MKTKHTPAPWTAQRHSPSLTKVETKTRVICDAIGGTDEDLVNAHLIAAAPELLAELQHMTDLYVEAMKDAGVTHYPEALSDVRKARAAIAKATASV